MLNQAEGISNVFADDASTAERSKSSFTVEQPSALPVPVVDSKHADVRQDAVIGLHSDGEPSVEVDVSGWAVVTLHGEQDHFEVGRSRAALREGVVGGRGRVVVDLSDVRFGDSSLLGALVGAAKMARRHGCRVRVVTSDEWMRRKLRITGLHQVFRVFPSLSEALAGSP